MFTLLLEFCLQINGVFRWLNGVGIRNNWMPGQPTYSAEKQCVQMNWEGKETVVTQRRIKVLIKNRAEQFIFPKTKKPL